MSYEPKSIWRAKAFGGSELKDYQAFLDWDATTYVLADLIDAVNVNTQMFIAANSQGQDKVPDVEPYPRPGVGKKPEAPSQSLDDFARGLTGMFGTNVT